MQLLLKQISLTQHGWAKAHTLRIEEPMLQARHKLGRQWVGNSVLTDSDCVVLHPTLSGLS